MKAYWVRVIWAFVLLKAASRVMKDAEDSLRSAMSMKEAIIESGVTVNGSYVEGSEIQEATPEAPTEEETVDG